MPYAILMLVLPLTAGEVDRQIPVAHTQLSFDGRWAIESWGQGNESEGIRNFAKQFEWRISGAAFSIVDPANANSTIATGKLLLHQGEHDKTCTIIVGDEEPLFGIYKYENGRLQICIALKESAPREFVARPRVYELLVLRRKR
jgi:hypothetical protein